MGAFSLSDLLFTKSNTCNKNDNKNSVSTSFTIFLMRLILSVIRWNFNVL